MRQILIALLGIIGFLNVANASDYTFRDGLYWKGSQAYTRSIVTRNGCRIYRYEKADYQDAVNGIVKNLTPLNPDWRSEFGKALAIREEGISFESAMRAAGFDYGDQQAAQQGQAGIATQTTAYSGSSIYGYPTATYASQLHVTNPVDMNVLVNRLANAGDDSRQAAQQVVDGLQNLASSGLAIAAIESQNRSLADNIRALGEAAERLKTSSVTQTVTQSGTGVSVGTIPPAPQVGTVTKSSLSIVETKCASCHQGDSPSGGISLDGSPITSALASAAIASAYLKSGKLDQRTADAIGGADDLKPMPQGDKPALSDQELDQLATEIRGWVQ